MTFLFPAQRQSFIETIIITFFGGIALFSLGIGITLLTGRIAAATRWRTTNPFWDLLLMLPYDRGEIALFLTANAYEPGPLTLTLILIELCALFLGGATCFFFIAVPLLLYEWMQWNALGMGVGLWAGHSRLNPELTALGFGLGLAIFRAGSGLLIAVVLGMPLSLAVMVGPLSIVRANVMGLLPGLLYLSLIEITVRQTFATAVARLGEH